MSINTLGKSFSNESEAIDTLESEITRLRKLAKAKEKENLKNLCKQVGLKSVDALIKKLLPFASPRMKASFSDAAPAKAKAAKSAAKGKRGKRGKLTADSHDKIKAAFAAGKKANEVAAQLGVSVATVNKIKKDLGLVKKRK